jgi:hypothetical protein
VETPAKSAGLSPCSTVHLREQPCLSLQGNLLRRGPVVFRIPPEAVRAIRKDADGGDTPCEQLMLDLYRCPLLQQQQQQHDTQPGCSAAFGDVREPVVATSSHRKVMFILDLSHSAPQAARCCKPAICCRVAALYVAERMRNEVVATIAAHYQQLALVAARRAVVRASHRRTMSRRDSMKVRCRAPP